MSGRTSAQIRDIQADHRVLSTHDTIQQRQEQIEVIGADELLTEAVEEVSGLVDDKQYSYEYDSMVHTQHDQNIIFQLYQPLETSHGTFVCRICLELGETVEFENKTSYTHHRYKVHGSYNIDHKMPIEMHFRMFANVGEFEVGSLNTLPSFRAVYFDAIFKPNRPAEMVFPEPPKHYADRPLQYVKMDLVAADSCVYLSTVYSHILIITDIKTGFIFSKPIPDTGAQPLLIRIVTDIFLQFGVPEGYSCTHSVTLIRDVMNAISGVFCVTIKEILFDTPDYGSFLRSLYDQAALELQSKNRWVEMVQFTTMVLNQSGSRSPFKRMFNRKPYNLSGHKVPPWLQNENFASDDDEEIDVLLDRQEEQAQCDDYFRSNSPRYITGDKVYLRNFEITASRGNALPYLYGSIGETDWENSPRFPYHVYFSKSKHPWPSEGSENIWASPYDVLPTTHDLLVISQEERLRVTSNLLCCCGGGDYGVPCSLFRSYLCANGMAKACCLSSTKPCGYHEECGDGDDSYNRMEALAKAYVNAQPRVKTCRCKRKRVGEEDVYSLVSPIVSGCQPVIPMLLKSTRAGAEMNKKQRRTEENTSTEAKSNALSLSSQDGKVFPSSTLELNLRIDWWIVSLYGTNAHCTSYEELLLKLWLGSVVEMDVGFARRLSRLVVYRERYDQPPESACTFVTNSLILEGKVNVLSEKYFRCLSVIANDQWYAALCNVNMVLIELWPKLHESCRELMLQFFREAVKLNVPKIENVIMNLVRSINGSVEWNYKLRHAHVIASILNDNEAWVMGLKPGTFMLLNVLTTFGHLIIDIPLGGAFEDVRIAMIQSLVFIVRNRFTDALMLGRELLLILMRLAKIPQINLIWVDLITNPTKFGLNDGIEDLFRSNANFYGVRLSTEMAKKLEFIICQCKPNTQDKHFEWFSNTFFRGPDGPSLRAEAIRYVLYFFKPDMPTHVLEARGHFLYYLLTTIPPNSDIEQQWCRNAVWFDWLTYDVHTSVQFIEPVMSMVRQALINAPMKATSLLEYVCRAITLMYPSRADLFKKAANDAMHAVHEYYSGGLLAILDNPRIERSIRDLIRETFADYFSRITSLPSATLQPAPLIPSSSPSSQPPTSRSVATTASNSNHTSVIKEKIRLKDGEKNKENDRDERERSKQSKTPSPPNGTVIAELEEIKKKKREEEIDDLVEQLRDDFKATMMSLRETFRETEDDSERGEAVQRLLQKLLENVRLPIVFSPNYLNNWEDSIDDEQLELVAHSVQLVMGGPVDGSRRSILPDPVTEDALADSFSHPLFIIFRNLCYTPDTDATTRSLMVNMIATMRDYDNTVTYLMLFFIKQCAVDDERLFAFLVPYVFQKLDVEAGANSFAQIVYASLDWPTTAQWAFWHLVHAEGIPGEWLIQLLPKLKSSQHAEAAANVLLMLKRAGIVCSAFFGFMPDSIEFTVQLVRLLQTMFRSRSQHEYVASLIFTDAVV
ncbi:unnamed protein product [Angiostrongylus costaricensis]|uniref:SOSS complex subunit A homolog n=1 Tax=Angiostrongylus costaricensis TaxID=334426 RepID=A0A158PG56_ANGCS|nr:unnamed protein product [Angiostrongylus costaricensis]